MMPLDLQEPVPPPSLEYAKPTTISRRQFNLLLLLVFINTLMFAAFVCLPAASPMLRQWWNDYQARRIEKQKQQQKTAMVQQVKTYTAPPTEVVYTEDPVEIRDLLARSGAWSSIAANSDGRINFPPQVLSTPIVRTAPAPLARVQAAHNAAIGGAIAHSGIIFLHARKDAGGREYLVAVWLHANRHINHATERPEGKGLRHDFEFRMSRTFRAYATPLDAPANRVSTAMHLHAHGERYPLLSILEPDPLPYTPRTLKPVAPVDLSLIPHVRIFAGQPDPADPSRFTITYQLDGQPGIIDGHLKSDGRVMLEPRQGTFQRWNGAADYDWSLDLPLPTTRPTTRPG